MSKSGSMLRAAGLLFALFFGVSLLGGGAPSAFVPPAAARSCASPAGFDVYPSDHELAPRNTRVVVVAKPSRGTPGWRDHDPPDIALRTEADSREVVGSSTEKIAAGNLTTIVVTPRSLLKADGAYMVWAGSDQIGHFRTSAEIDREPPRWEGVNEIETSRHTGAEDYSCFGNGGVSLLIEPATDSGHVASQISYALFANQSKTPFLYLRAHGGGLFLSAADGIIGASRAERFDVTIRAADRAGNFSAPHSYRIDVGVDGVWHPRESSPWALIAAAAALVSLATYGMHRHRRARTRREAAYTL
jgi:hypothetical protein